MFLKHSGLIFGKNVISLWPYVWGFSFLILFLSCSGDHEKAGKDKPLIIAVQPFKDIHPERTVVIRLTSKDISASKGNIRDFGIMGLGYRPGNACIASSFRLSKNKTDEQLFKIAVHELGHTQGLQHCPVKTCFMRSAEGKNPTDKETGFCRKCQTFLMNKNWKII